MKSKAVILVTGGTGYIGSHTVIELLQSDFEVVIVDNLSNSFAESVDRINMITDKKPVFYKADLCDSSQVSQIFDKHQFDAVIHFAALKAVGESVEKPLFYYRNNLISLLNLLQACKMYKVNQLVFSSSCTVYGQPDCLPVTEDTPVSQPHSPYGNTKKISEEILFDCSHSSDLKVIALRYFNPCGAHPSGLIGEFPAEKPNNLMPVITQAAAGLLKFFEVYGDDYDTPDGSCIRDYIHVTDLARAHVKAIDRLTTGDSKSKFEIFNVGIGQGISVFQMIQTFERLTGIRLNYKISTRRSGDIARIWADTSKAEKELGWKAKFTLDDMINTAWKWQQNLISKPV
ncbi:MAG: UDP-glucose 4-epimerase GalE [Bacteroidia bacterium]|nr:UDP-glucose 4-epimerase GalE [Bacteroidia bacterium]MCZ2277501.1 UDP-glucose 4-epimerase GalE [Bacteroidia bacterium]